MKNIRYSHFNKGFTLLELLISITLVGVILVIVMGALRIGVRSWEKGEQDIDQFQKLQTVPGLIQKQLSSICRVGIPREDGTLFYFSGDDRSLECISGVSLVPGSDYGKVYVRYEISEDTHADTKNLMIYERDIVSTITENFIDEEIGKDEMIELISGLADISFEYPVQNELDEIHWENAWEPDTEAEMPPAVRITFRFDDTTPAINILARINVHES